MAGIIKAGNATTVTGNPRQAVFNFDDMSQTAERYLESIRGQAAEIVAQAQAQADGIRRQAEQQGQQAAEQAAQQTFQTQIEQRLQAALPAVNQVVLQLEQARHDWQQQWEAGALQLALRIAERLIHKKIEQEPQIPLQWIRESLELASGVQHVSLHLNPHDHACLAGQLTDLCQQLGRLAPAEVVSDPQVQPGGCVVHTEFGRIDQQLETQLARIEEEWLEI